MNEALLTAKEARQLRGLLLDLIYINHKQQRERLTSTVLWGTVRREGYQFSRLDVITVLQDLRDRDYLRYQQVREDERVFLHSIEITARGRDLCDRIFDDPAVQTQ